LRKIQVANQSVSHLVSAGTCIVKEQQHSMIALSLGSALIGGSQNSIYFSFFQVRYGRMWALLERNGPDLSVPRHMLRAVQANEMGQGMDRGQALVLRGHTTGSHVFQFLQEQSHSVGGYVIDNQSINRSARTTGE
jgi:hypothetical protein